MQQKSSNNSAMESKAYNKLKQLEKTRALFNADHIYCNPPQLLDDEKNCNKEAVNNLKSVLILHEVVKDQKEELVNKDKIIAKLKQENEELKQRLEKYEKERRDQQQSNNNSRKTKGISTTTTTNNQFNSDNEAANITVETPNKRRKLNGKWSEINQKTPINGQSNGNLPIDPYEFTVDEPTPHQQLRQEVVPATPNSNNNETTIKSKKFITTNSDYIICDWQKSDAERDAEVEPLLRATLEIPSWTTKERIHPCAYPIEAMEDMKDDTFIKRHNKFETDERRRKKWDVQRLREQKRVERLRKHYLKDEFDEQQKIEQKSITSFNPSADQVKYIQIVEELPVVAFGEPIPYLPESDFVLPWMSNTNNKTNNMSPTTCFVKTRFFCRLKNKIC